MDFHQPIHNHLSPRERIIGRLLNLPDDKLPLVDLFLTSLECGTSILPLHVRYLSAAFSRGGAAFPVNRRQTATNARTAIVEGLAPCSAASAVRARNVLRDRQHLPQATFLSITRSPEPFGVEAADADQRAWLAIGGVGGVFQSLPFCRTDGVGFSISLGLIEAASW